MRNNELGKILVSEFGRLNDRLTNLAEHSLLLAKLMEAPKEPIEITITLKDGTEETVYGTRWVSPCQQSWGTLGTYSASYPAVQQTLKVYDGDELVAEYSKWASIRVA